MAATTGQAATEADLLRMPSDGWKYELVDGEIRVSPAGARHGQVCIRLSMRLGGFVEQGRLGYVFDSSTGFRLPGGNVRLPDVSFVARGRFKAEKVPDGFGDVVPDLAIEVLSPDDRARDVLDKVGEYLQAGVRLVWVVDPKRERAVAYRSLTDTANIGPDDLLDAGEVLPGFRVKLREILD
jgi:Uma2 family endonuclease